MKIASGSMSYLWSLWSRVQSGFSLDRSSNVRIEYVSVKQLFTKLVLLFLLTGSVFVIPLEPSSTEAKSIAPGVVANQLQSPEQQEPEAKSSSSLFIENVGQFDANVYFKVFGGMATTWITENAIWITLIEDRGSSDSLTNATPEDSRSSDFEGRDSSVDLQAVNLQLTFPNANPSPQLEPFQRQESRFNYFMGDDPHRWYTNVPVWHGVRYRNLYPGIDLEITYEGSQLIQQLVIKDEKRLRANPELLNEFRPSISGADSLVVEGNYVRVATSLGEIMLPLLRVKGMNDTSILPLEAVVQTATDQTPETIDTHLPAQAESLLYSTFLGAADVDKAYGIALGPADDLYIAGLTESAGFPVTIGETTLAGGEDVFVARLAPSGTGANDLIFATFVGGSNSDQGLTITVDDTGSPIVAGLTSSSNFPYTAGAYQQAYRGGESDAFLLKLNPTGDTLTYSTYIGGADSDVGRALVLDAAGAIYLTGETDSADFPTTTEVWAGAISGGSGEASIDAFVLKLNPAGNGATDLLYATYLGGERKDFGKAIALDEAGAVYVAGATDSYAFPTTAGAWDLTYADTIIGSTTYDDGFVTKLDATGTSLLYSTYLGGGYSETVNGLALDETGSIYLVGGTTSADFPATAGAYDTSYNGGTLLFGGDTFLAKLNPAGSDLIYATYLGGAAAEQAYAVAVDDRGDAYIAGTTLSKDFPTTPDAIDDSYNGSLISPYFDAVVARLDAAGKNLVYSTYLGGSNVDSAAALALAESGNLYVAGWSKSSEFPTTSGAYDPTFNGSGISLLIKNDAFVAKINSGSHTEATYEISGQVIYTNSVPAAGVRIDAGAGFTATTSDSGNFVLTGLPAGQYTITPSKDSYLFTPPSRIVAVPTDTAKQNFVAHSEDATFSKPPLLVVHGLRLDEGYSCSLTPVRYTGDRSQSTLGDLPQWFYEDGDYQVWMAHLLSSLQRTPSILGNTPCLFQQIDALYEISGGQKITIIAHSMGGLVGRACLAFEGCRNKVKAIYTLGTPHGGAFHNKLLKLLIGLPSPLVGEGFCLWQTVICEFGVVNMATSFNLFMRNQVDVDYVFIGGDATPVGLGTAIWITEGTNDGIFGVKSSIGFPPRTSLYIPPGWGNASLPVQIVTDEVHFIRGNQYDAPFFFGGYAYHENRPQSAGGTTQGRSQTYACIRHLLNTGEVDGAPTECRASNATEQKQRIQTLEQTTPLQATVSLTGTVTSGESDHHLIQVDATPRANFMLYWTSDTLKFSLIRPDGQRITPAYTAANSDMAAYTMTNEDSEFLPHAAYAIRDPLPGAWQVQITGTAAVSGTVAYMGFVDVESNLTLSIDQDPDQYSSGTEASFNATVWGENGGIKDASVVALLSRPDGMLDSVTFAEVGEGIYRASYTVPDIAGNVAMRVVATGIEDGIGFSRQVERVWTILPDDRGIVFGEVQDQGVDIDGNGLFDLLTAQVTVNIPEPATYDLFAELSKNGTRIGSTSVTQQITTTGPSIFELQFEGEKIQTAGLDGQFTIGTVVLVNTDLGYLVDSEQNLHTTAAYRADQFGTLQSKSTFLPYVTR